MPTRFTLKASENAGSAVAGGTLYDPDENGEFTCTNVEDLAQLKLHGYAVVREEEIVPRERIKAVEPARSNDGMPIPEPAGLTVAQPKAKAPLTLAQQIDALKAKAAAGDVDAGDQLALLGIGPEPAAAPAKVAAGDGPPIEDLTDEDIEGMKHFALRAYLTRYGVAFPSNVNGTDLKTVARAARDQAKG